MDQDGDATAGAELINTPRIGLGSCRIRTFYCTVHMSRPGQTQRARPLLRSRSLTGLLHSPLCYEKSPKRDRDRVGPLLLSRKGTPDPDI